jgi:LysR family transcriptional regulator, salicylic acid-responsive activator of bsdBCD
MDIRQLKYFLAIAQTGQITRAAKQLNIEQPPLSRQLKQMEEELGVKLFDRDGKKLHLTEAGELLRGKAEQLLVQFEEALKQVKESEELVQGVLSIGSVVSCISLLPKQMERFRHKYPEVTYKIIEGDHTYLGDLLDRRVIELVIARLPFEAKSPSDTYSILPLPSDPFVVVIPASWTQYAGVTSISMKEIASFPFLSLKSDTTIRMHEQLMNECRRHGFEPNVICECSSVAIIMSLIAEGLGVTVFPKSIMSSFPVSEVNFLDIDDADFYSEVGIIWLRSRYLTKAAERFIEGFQNEEAHDSPKSTQNE